MTLATGHSRLRRLVSGGLLLATLALAAPAVPVAAAGPRDVMPDLAMAVPDSFRVCGAPTSGTFQTENCPDAAPGNRWLRFDSLIVNVGRGTFRVVARRASVEQEEMGAVQWIRRTDKTWRKVPTNARLAWAIEEVGHSHWHTQCMEK